MFIFNKQIFPILFVCFLYDKWGFHLTKHNILSGSMQDQSQRRWPSIKTVSNKSNRPAPQQAHHADIFRLNAGPASATPAQHRTTKDPTLERGSCSLNLGPPLLPWPSTKAIRLKINTGKSSTLTPEKSSRTPRPGFRLYECYRQKFGLIFCKHNCI